jgi:hypothetical protein
MQTITYGIPCCEIKLSTQSCEFCLQNELPLTSLLCTSLPFLIMGIEFMIVCLLEGFGVFAESDIK